LVMKHKKSNWLVAEIRKQKKSQKKWLADKQKAEAVSKSGPVVYLNPTTFVPQTPNTKRINKLFVASHEFLQSFEWRRVRMQALKQHGSRCQCCGASPKDGIRIHVDHIKPRKTHPELALSLNNLQVLCEVCNHGKGNWDSTDWR